MIMDVPRTVRESNESVAKTAGKSADGRSKKRPGPEQQARSIVEAAVELCLSQGSRSVSIAQICQRADVSRSTFYRCFADKDALLRHVYSISVYEPVQRIMLSILDQSELSAEAIRQALGELLDAIFAQGRYAELIFRESNDPNSPAFEVIDAAFDRIVTAMRQVLPLELNDAIFLKSLLCANQWIAHDAIRKGLEDTDRQAAKEAAWRLVSNSLNLV